MSKFIFVRGLPGSGKTRLARKLAEQVTGAVMVSADDFFEVEGEYRFDPRKLGEAHASCMRRTLQAMRDKVPLIIVHNTGSQAWEVENYLEAALLAGYKVEIYEIAVGRAEDLLRFFKRQSHGVPAETFGAMFLRWDSLDPKYLRNSRNTPYL